MGGVDKRAVRDELLEGTKGVAGELAVGLLETALVTRGELKDTVRGDVAPTLSEEGVMEREEFDEGPWRGCDPPPSSSSSLLGIM